ncbi:MAG TPA: sulfide/dihydroorotate dehydrogenase-like FAD/NAD-binding protein [Spirochaetota bacterium]|nr:sulfide/dihydroorotate dehydrogenase-like FAD/NAD-binding protein [Spirochaetota bacterium]HOM37747.1 sulfide/dihydroorotate dehydrogenase-like FAD/NAD-binding protein [Spirochaetota bacterium]HPQ49376.1 sulfide/dihydroorotate dehydrogenase-like FAD/NAD-binding protein [Spirochaetota bacterium]
MFKVLRKKIYNQYVFELEIEAPLIAREAKAGQFCILIPKEKGERLPFTIADFDRKKGTITFIIQVVGKSTQMMYDEEYDFIPDILGPLGTPSKIEKKNNVLFLSGGLGIAASYPIMKAYKEMGSKIISVVGFRNKSLVFWEDKLKDISDEIIITTDDGSYGLKGNVVSVVDQIFKKYNIDKVYSIGSLKMMKASVDAIKKYGVEIIVSLNPIMVDGIGMCGACRVVLDGKIHYACIEGPDFDGYKVDLDDLILRSNQFAKEEGACLRDYLLNRGNRR